MTHVGIDAQVAVCSTGCTLAPELRHYVMTLAVLAHRATGVGIAGQERVAAAMGVTVRTVQRLGRELAADTLSPVRVERRQRRRTDGYRTSDEYRLVVQSPDAHDGRDAAGSPDTHDGGDPLTRHGRHPTRATTSPDTGDDLTRHGRHPSDPGSDPSSDPSSTAPTSGAGVTPALKLVPPESKPKPKTKPKTKPKSKTKQPDPRVVPLRNFYVAEYRRANADAEPALSENQWGRAMRAFGVLLQATKSDERARLCIARTFADPWRRSKAVQPWEIAADANKILADNGAPPNARIGHLQRGGGERDLEAARRRGEQFAAEGPA